MARVVQGTSSAGYGGLEMVIHDFHSWLIENGHDAQVIVLEGTALHKSLIESGYEKSTIVYSGRKASEFVENVMREKLDSDDTAFLFHRHRALRGLVWRRLKGKTSMLSHTFYKSKKRDIWHRYLFSKIDQWIALTPLHKQNMIELLGLKSSRIKIIPNGVSLQRFQPAQRFDENKEEIHLCIVARLDPQKGQDLAIEALARLKKLTQKKIILHFLGDETPGEASIRPHLQALCKKLMVENEVKFDGFTTQIEEVLPQMDILWMPSHRETFGRCLIEAMACGVPVIGSDAGGVPDIIDHKVNGLLFQTMNVDDLVSQTLYLIRNPLARKNIRENALREVRSIYDMDQVFSELLRTILPDHISDEKSNFTSSKRKIRLAPEPYQAEAQLRFSPKPE